MMRVSSGVRLVAAVAALTVFGGLAAGGGPAARAAAPEAPAGLMAADKGRTIRANITAFEQPLVYNRFGSFNPFGMLFALDHDLVEAESHRIGDSECDARWKLRDGVRPRPLVLRANVGDTLVIRLRNGLLAEQPDLSDCTWRDGEHFTEKHAYLNRVAEQNQKAEAGEVPAAKTNWPATRDVSLTVSGMTPLGDGGGLTRAGLVSIPPKRGDEPWPTHTYRFAAERPGTYLFFSNAAPAGGQGDGGSLTHGLVGMVNVLPEGSRWFRSQVDAETLASARLDDGGGAAINYNAVDAEGTPLLDMLKPAAYGAEDTYELVAGDINAIIVDCIGAAVGTERCQDRKPAFREFVAMFHDELKTFYSAPFRALGARPELSGVADGFGINFGASGMGTILLANRLGVGPSADCTTCLYEEFFLQSWANGDPALLPEYASDPANVAHSYLGDRVVFRNTHAGPKETHVFHLHAHQWMTEQVVGPEENNLGTYVDSQTIAPQQGFSYSIYHDGSGNRNMTVGDSIFHCHLYPHFAQGMWGLWRVHDVLEDGTRRLPDGELGPGTNPRTGANDGGTPIPAVVPLPLQAMPPAPDYDNDLPGYPFFIPGEEGQRAPQPPLDMVEDGGLPRHVVTGRGERAIHGLSLAETAEVGGPREQLHYALLHGEFRLDPKVLQLKILPEDGTPLEKAAMAFHGEGATASRAAEDGENGAGAGEAAARRPGHASLTPEGAEDVFAVNGAPPVPGAPFADPCTDDRGRSVTGGAGDPENTRKYEVSAVDLQLVTNKAGWHDPQARVNVLTEDAPQLEGKASNGIDPFFFRALSGECIVFAHQNRTRAYLERDDFQVATPTDTIGQHIHLVKFDVLSADGSANGFNYEDGTLAKHEISVRLKAGKAEGGSITDVDGNDVAANLPDEATGYQTTVQRWYADPLLTRHLIEGEVREVGDRTVRTVFTHDHFAPSSIQQHGFYSALLVEAPDSEIFRPDGTPMTGDQMVGAQAIVKVPDAGHDLPEGVGPLHESHREFALAIADFALLYDPNVDHPETGLADLDDLGQRIKGMPNLLLLLENADDPDAQARYARRPEFEKGYLSRDENLWGLVKPLDEQGRDPDPDTGRVPSKPAFYETAHDHMKEQILAWRGQYGRPVAPPQLPEAISKDHHDPYLFNYKHEPVPLRIAESARPSGDTRCGASYLRDSEQVTLSTGRTLTVGTGVRVVRDGDDSDPESRQASGSKGDLQHLFASQHRPDSSDPFTGHGDPCTPILEAFEGERVKVRLIQGAQEVQHVFHAPGLRWPRSPADPGSPRVAAQEIGISEHMEFEVPALQNVERGAAVTDYLYGAASIDAIWNGAWGLLRAYDIERSDPVFDMTKVSNDIDGCWQKYNDFLDGNGPGADEHRECALGDRLARLSHVTGESDGQGETAFDVDNLTTDRACPVDAPVRAFVLEAWRVQDWLGGDGRRGFLLYNRNRSIADWNAAAFFKVYEGLVRDEAGELVPAEAVRGGFAGLKNRLIRDVADEGRRQLRQRHRSAYPNADPIEPVVLRARAGECILIVLSNKLMDDAGAPAGDRLPADPHAAGLPPITSLRAGEVQPSGALSLAPQVLHAPMAAYGPPIGFNQKRQVARPGGHAYFAWYAGTIDLKHVDGEETGARGRRVAEPQPVAFGPINLVSWGDQIMHGVRGLVGALIVEPADAEISYPVEGSELTARIVTGGRTIREFVVVAQDGLSLMHNGPQFGWEPQPIPDCLVCDDSYDLGEKGANYRSYPFWSMPGLRASDNAIPGPETDLNSVVFPRRFMKGPGAWPGEPFRAKEGETVWVRVLQPAGRARQRAFLLYGHDYDEQLGEGWDTSYHVSPRDWAESRSPHSALIGAGKTFTAEIESARKGTWIWRDGPNHIWAGGAWGEVRVE